MDLKSNQKTNENNNDFLTLFEVETSEKSGIAKKSISNKRFVTLVSASTFLLLIATVISICIGRYTISVSDVLATLLDTFKHLIWSILGAVGFDFPEPPMVAAAETSVILYVRIPRVIAAILIGGALSFSGATYQSLFRNPMVSPDILGASAGASVGACFMMLLNQKTIFVQIGAFLFGVLAVVISCMLSKTVAKNKDSVLMLVLCGMSVSALFQAFVSIIKYLADPDSQLPEMTYWLMGSIAKVDLNDIIIFLVTVFVGTIPIIALSWKLNILSLGEDDARAMGINVSLIRAICVCCSTLLTATVVSYAGTIGWVGLMIPHLCRMIVGPNNKQLLPISFLVGSLFLLIIDDLCRTLFVYEIPLGVLTSVLGTPFFILVLCRRKGDI